MNSTNRSFDAAAPRTAPASVMPPPPLPSSASTTAPKLSPLLLALACAGAVLPHWARAADPPPQLAPSPALAPPPAREVQRSQAPLYLRADELSGQPSATVQAQGSVEMRQAGVVVRADQLRYDQAEEMVRDLLQVQAGLDALVAEAHPVSCEWITDEEMLANPQLVKSMSVSPPIGFGRVRLLRVHDVDLQPCGGTHVRNTSEIGRVRVAKIEKKSARTRRVVLEFAD